MITNFNIGLLGHVDSGKTTLARVLSTVSSTAAFDKNPQSQERGITLDLGFSSSLVAVPEHVLLESSENIEKLQYTFVDCPGHASLIRTIIGGAQIIDLMILVVDAQKGIQTQTAECIVIGELLKRKLIVVVNKIDLLEASTRSAYLKKLNAKLLKTLEKTAFGGEVPIYNVSALDKTNIEQLLEGIAAAVHIPQRDTDKPFLMYVDHCFSIKGQGTVCTGTIIQGSVKINDLIEIPAIGELRKVKSIQMFRQSVPAAVMGDRVGLCVTQFNAKQLERGVISKPSYLKPMYAACVRVHRIPYYKGSVKSKSKLHITVGHETVMGTVTLFEAGDATSTFDVSREYAFMAELSDELSSFALIEFEKPLLCKVDAALIASKLDMDANSNQCRLAFWGDILWCTHSANYVSECLPSWKIYKTKVKEGSIQRMANDSEAIVQNLFKKESNRDIFVGKAIELSTGEMGVIESTFGSSSKVKICFRNGLRPETLEALKCVGGGNDVKVLLKYKKYVFNKKLGVLQ